MRTEQVNYFLEVVETGSFTKAAENLHMHHTSLREAIIALENELGKTLLLRSKKGVELTEVGKYCMPHFQHIAESYNKLCLDCIPDTPNKEILKIDAQSLFETYLLQLYSIIRPKIDVEMNIENNLDEILNRLVQNKISMAFVCISKDERMMQLLQTLKKNSLETSVLSTFDIGIMIRKEHPLAKKKIVRFDELFEFGFCFYNNLAPVKTIIKYEAAYKDVKMLTLSNRKLMEKYIKNTNMIAFMPINSIIEEDFLLRPLSSPPVLELQALYMKGNMDDEMIYCINMMKRIITLKK